MIIDKEYPATHSMSTSWFAIDVDGNVALIEFNENGPVPDGVPEDNLDDIVFVDPFSFIDGFPTLPYTDEQAQAMLDCPYDEMSDDWNSGIYIVRPELVSQFMQKVFASIRNQVDPDVIRLSKNSHAFYIDAYGGNIPHILECMKQKDYFIGYINIDMYVNDTYPKDTDEIVWDFKHPPLPYYVYGQPYSTRQLMERVYKPEFPLKAEQLPIQMQRGALHLQLKFAETAKFQIAEYYPFESMADSVITIENKEYHKLPNDRGKRVWFCTKSLPVSANMDCRNCKKCKKKMGQNNPVSVAFCDCPTVLFVIMPDEYSLYTYESKRGELFISKSVVTPLVQGYPSADSYKNKISTEIVAQIFKTCKVHFETTIEALLPQVIIVEDACSEILASCYVWNLHAINVNGKSFPCYKTSEMEEHTEEITELANRNYRGEILFRPTFTDYELGTIVD